MPRTPRTLLPSYVKVLRFGILRRVRLVFTESAQIKRVHALLPGSLLYESFYDFSDMQREQLGAPLPPSVAQASFVIFCTRTRTGSSKQLRTFSSKL